MKLSMVLSAGVAAMAFLIGGCRYDKAANGDFSTAGDSGADALAGQDIANEATDVGSLASEGSLDDLEAAGKSFADLYPRCTDVNFTPVYFAFDSTVVPPAQLPKIDAVVRHLIDRRDRVVIVEGHCDERGSNEYNLSLGENRAIIIRNYLVQSGIAAERIQTRSFGAESPAVDGHDESAWSQNRRGEFAIYQK